MWCGMMCNVVLVQSHWTTFNKVTARLMKGHQALKRQSQARPWILAVLELLPTLFGVPRLIQKALPLSPRRQVMLHLGDGLPGPGILSLTIL
jgi:hypothetical protein